MLFWSAAKSKKWGSKLFFMALLISLVGVTFIYSAEDSQHHRNLYYLKQMFSIFLAVIVYSLVSRWDYHFYSHASLWIYLGGIVLLLLVLIFGMRIHGAKSWINLGFYNGQLAEFAKIAFILSFAHLLTKYQEQSRWKRFFFLSFGFLAPYLLLLIVQPDFGTAVIFLSIFLFMFFVGGGDIQILLFLAPIFLLSIFIPFLGFYLRTFYPQSHWIFLDFSTKQLFLMGFLFMCLSGFFLIMRMFLQFYSSFLVIGLATLVLSISLWGGAVFKSCLRDYHYERILVTLQPNLDPEKKGYNLNQSLISIGGGKFLGYGWTKGPQNRGHFLPANHTDFILSVIAEEWGFVGVVLVIILNVLLIYQLTKIAMELRDRFGFLILVGISGLLISHFLINVFSVVGFLPIIGIPLPFLSYGGSFMMSCFVCLGIADNIRTSRYHFRKDYR